ncbi:CLUMA_CG002788, isoform A [Clunio marinus]|uniref:CLUMA_CG002788, isoform A n=1 Tax=Clunio marinus TaxID=568069 RepID=A0A1J1HLY5_9DIPT|nr:CLUMA_CG002788, isoform A [Clunio marinus]
MNIISIFTFCYLLLTFTYSDSASVKVGLESKREKRTLQNNSTIIEVLFSTTTEQILTVDTTTKPTVPVSGDEGTEDQYEKVEEFLSITNMDEIGNENPPKNTSIEIVNRFEFYDELSGISAACVASFHYSTTFFLMMLSAEESQMEDEDKSKILIKYFPGHEINNKVSNKTENCLLFTIFKDITTTKVEAKRTSLYKLSEKVPWYALKVRNE